MIPLYILGMLLRFGPQHGYQIRKLLSDQLADFTDIKLPTIYYHLEKMEQAGYLVAQNEKEGLRPERRVYAISQVGKERFQKLLDGVLELAYRPVFEADSALFFSDYLDGKAFTQALGQHVQRLQASIKRILQHRSEVLPQLPPEMRGSAGLIFEHHLLHYQAEMQWAESAITQMEERVK